MGSCVTSPLKPPGQQNVKSIPNNILLINANGEGFTIIPLNELNKINEFLMIKTDYRLLLRLLRGPKFAHWNNAEIGSHLEFIRNPNIYERGLFYCLNFFHA